MYTSSFISETLEIIHQRSRQREKRHEKSLMTPAKRNHAEEDIPSKPKRLRSKACSPTPFLNLRIQLLRQTCQYLPSYNHEKLLSDGYFVINSAQVFLDLYFK